MRYERDAGFPAGGAERGRSGAFACNAKKTSGGRRGAAIRAARRTSDSGKNHGQRSGGGFCPARLRAQSYIVCRPGFVPGCASSCTAAKRGRKAPARQRTVRRGAHALMPSIANGRFRENRKRPLICHGGAAQRTNSCVTYTKPFSSRQIPMPTLVHWLPRMLARWPVLLMNAAWAFSTVA